MTTTQQGIRRWYAFGYQNRTQAEEAIDDCFCSGEISACDAPDIQTYLTSDKKRRFGITLRD